MTSNNNKQLPATGDDGYQLPFSIDLGMSSVQGALGLAAEGIRVEWREYDLLENPRGALNELVLAWSAIRSVEYRPGLFGAKVLVSCTSASALGNFPLPAGSLNLLACSVKRRYRGQAELFSAEAGLRLAEL